MVSGLSHVQTLIACALVALAVWVVQQVRVLDARAEAADARRELAQERATRAELWAEFEAESRKQEAEHRRQMDAIAAETQRKLDDAQAAADRTVADLRAGNIRLRAHWEGCQATAELSRAAESAASADDAAKLREQAAARIVRVGAECDAHVMGLQSVIRTYTKATN